MPQVLVRDLDPTVVGRLRARARRSGRSLQAELRSILEQAAQTDAEAARILAAHIRRRLAKRAHSDSVTLLARDRAR